MYDDQLDIRAIVANPTWAQRRTRTGVGSFREICSLGSPAAL